MQQTTVIETALLTCLLAALLLCWRWAIAAARVAWGSLRAWERVLLVLALAPVPGPLDELLGGWLIARGLRRARRATPGPCARRRA